VHRDDVTGHVNCRMKHPEKPCLNGRVFSCPVNITMKNLIKAIADSIAELITSRIKQEIDCSPHEAQERFQYGLASLFSEKPEEPSAPPPKTRKYVPRSFGKAYNREDFPPDLMKQHFYEIDGRVFHRIKPPYGRGQPNREAGAKANSNTRPETYVIRFMGYRFPRSHIVYVLNHGVWPTRKIFHIDFDRTNDRIDNLQQATNSEINRSSRCSKRNLLGVKGVSAQDDHFRTSIKRNGLIYKLGNFLTASEAHRAYAEAAKQLHGHFNPASRLYLDNEEK
jgi:hypothetical protein